MDEQRVQTVEGEEIHLEKGGSGWPYINGQRVGAVNFIDYNVIALTVQERTFYLLLEEYQRVMEQRES